MVSLRAGLAALALWASPAIAEPCRLALVLAMDVSSSVDAEEYDLQRVGLAAALDAAEVRHAILAGGAGAVALSVYEWSGINQQSLQLDWTWLQSQGDIDQAIAAILTMERQHEQFPTSIGPALAYGARLLERGPECTRRVIDVSGDGVNNDRYGPQEAYRHFPFSGVTVNGLVILGHDPEVAAYYASDVLRGPAAFLMLADGYDDFQNAMTRKLYREINDIVLGQSDMTQPEGG